MPTLSSLPTHNTLETLNKISEIKGIISSMVTDSLFQRQQNRDKAKLILHEVVDLLVPKNFNVKYLYLVECVEGYYFINAESSEACHAWAVKNDLNFMSAAYPNEEQVEHMRKMNAETYEA